LFYHSVSRPNSFLLLLTLLTFCSHLPATLLASFIKRLSRLSLNAPPAAIVMVIPFTYNILKRHPALMVMIHRVPAEDDDVSSTGTSHFLYPLIDFTSHLTTKTDPFNADELNPNLTNALTSSLWELYSHKRHYHAGVSTLARVFEEAFTKMPYAMEDFLDHGYGTVGASLFCFPRSSQIPYDDFFFGCVFLLSSYTSTRPFLSFEISFTDD
jgi:U3 small nucleolar RNA-associated protein 19